MDILSNDDLRDILKIKNLIDLNDFILFWFFLLLIKNAGLGLRMSQKSARPSFYFYLKWLIIKKET